LPGDRQPNRNFDVEKEQFMSDSKNGYVMEGQFTPENSALVLIDFMEVGVPVATRATPPPKLGDKEQAAFIEKVKALAPKYRTELLREA
jgi:hypothetical protein